MGRIIRVAALILSFTISSTCSYVSDVFRQYRISPDVIPVPPNKPLQVTYPNNVRVNFGNVLRNLQTARQPTVAWECDPNAMYTLIFVATDLTKEYYTPTGSDPVLRLKDIIRYDDMVLHFDLNTALEINFGITMARYYFALRFRHAAPIGNIYTLCPNEHSNMYAKTVGGWGRSPYKFPHGPLTTAVDPDAFYPSLNLPGEFLHWLVYNIARCDVGNGIPLARYLLPNTPPGSPPHRYTFLLFKQKGPISASLMEIIQSITRASFNTQGFVTKHNLGIPVAGNFFLGILDIYIGLL